MSRLSLRRPVLAALVSCGLATLVLSPAHAGIGDFVKKAKDKAAQAVSGKSPASSTAAPEGAPVQFDEVTVELTPARLDKIIQTLGKAQAAGTARATLVAQLDKLQEERHQVFEKNQKQIEGDRNKRGEVESCYGEGYGRKRDEKSQAYAKRALSDPALRDKYTKAAAQYNEAAARGDSTAIAKLNEIMMGEILPSKEDSAEVRKACGPLPPKSTAERKVEELDKQIADQQDAIRASDAKEAAQKAESTGLTDAQWAMAMDRIQAFLTAKPAKPSGKGLGFGKSSGSSSSGADNEALLRRSFSQTERDAMEARLEELRKLVH